MRHDAPGLPARPDHLSTVEVACWDEPLVMPTYAPASPTTLPAFLAQRVYQGSSGTIYPMPLIEAVATTPQPHSWQAIHLENDWIRLVVLPELGGRIHIGFDRVRGYDFFYRQDVIKPALVGLAGPWISGGVEFNWPQHHRPATFLPTEVEIEHEEDGSVTVWCSDHDPLTRMKGMHGIRLAPDRAVIELLVRVHNRTEVPQTFLWWANVAARVDEHYQSFFPTDVHFVADHANRATTGFPAADRPYYGIDYPSRVSAETPDADRLDWYRNIPVPTSYMVLETADEFFGGYDHGREAGFVHWASREVSPGKKQWTWGNAEFGWAWDRALTDDGGHYVELMAGVHTNNQPDFSFLQPGETKTFTQLWYPIGGVGPVHQATPDAAGHLSLDGTMVRLRLQATRALDNVDVTLRADDLMLETWSIGHLPAGEVLVLDRDLGSSVPGTDSGQRLRAELHAGGRAVLRVRPAGTTGTAEVPPPAREPDPPEQVASNDELHLIGTHLEQYRHATRSPELWWQEALRRDPGDLRTNVAMGLRRYRAGDLDEALRHLETAVARQSLHNLNPRDAEGHYLLGLVLARRGEVERAWTLLARAGWDGHWWLPAQLAMARLELLAGDDLVATHRVLELVEVAPQQLEARNLAVVGLRRLGREDDARELVEATLATDPLDAWARALAGGAPALDPVTWLDVAKEFARVGSWTEALAALDAGQRAPSVLGMTGVAPLLAYHRARAVARSGGDPRPHLQAARSADPRWCLAIDLDDVDVLDWALEQDEEDALAHSLLGSWCQHWRRYDEAHRHWQRSAQLAATPVVARNLGLHAHNQLGDPQQAWRHYLGAVDLAPEDPALLSELDQLAERLRQPALTRLNRLADRRALVEQRHDLALSMACLMVLTGDPAGAVALLGGRVFQPWEGGEGQVLACWEVANLLAALAAVGNRAWLEQAMHPPPTLGEARHPLVNRAHLDLIHGDLLAGRGLKADAAAAWQRSAHTSGDFREMATTAHSDLTFFQVLALRRLGDEQGAAGLRTELATFTEQLASSTAGIDHFATSLPQLLLFERPAEADRDDRVSVLRAQLELLDGPTDGPAVQAAARRVPHHLIVELSRQVAAGDAGRPV